MSNSGERLLAAAIQRTQIAQEGYNFAETSIRSLIPSSLSPDDQEGMMAILAEQIDFNLPSYDNTAKWTNTMVRSFFEMVTTTGASGAIIMALWWYQETGNVYDAASGAI